MVVKIIGVQELDFETRQGERIQGTNLFAEYPDDYVVGVKCEKFFVRKSIDCKNIAVNSYYDITFDRRGKIDKIVDADVEID